MGNADKLKSLLGDLSQQTNSLRLELKETRQSIDALDVKCQAMLDQPLCKADFEQYISSCIDQIAKDKVESWRGYFIDLANKQSYGAPAMSIGSFVSAEIDAKYSSPHWFIRRGVYNQSGWAMDDEELCFLFQDEIKKSFGRAFEGIEDWPFPNAQAFSQIKPQLDSARAEQEQLIKKERELTSLAQELRIEVEPWERLSLTEMRSRANGIAST